MSPGDTIGPDRDLRSRGSCKPKPKAAPLLGARTSFLASVKQRAWTQGLAAGSGSEHPPRGGHQQARCLHPTLSRLCKWPCPGSKQSFFSGWVIFQHNRVTGAADSVRGTERNGMKGPCVPEIFPGKTLWLIPARGRGARENPAEGPAAAWRRVPNLSGRRNPRGPHARHSLVPPRALALLRGSSIRLPQQLPEGRGGGVGSGRESSNLQKSGAALVSRGGSPRLAPLEGTMHVGPFII